MNYKKIQIVGTNGKGSVSKFLNDNLISEENKIGLFTSPHILNFEERIKINNVDIDFVMIQSYMTEIHLKFPQYTFGFFQLIFLSCLAYFEDKKIDIAIFEAGIGAKKDIVNYLDFDITVFTSISLDHENILGASVQKITEDKSFAIKKKNIVYCSNIIPKASIDILVKRAQLMKNNHLKIVNIKSQNIHEQNQELVSHVLQKEFDIKAHKFVLPIGRAQEIIINDKVCYLDVGHNEDGIKKTLSYFKEKNINFDSYVVSISKDKDVNKIMMNFDDKNTSVYQNKSSRALENNFYPKTFTRIFSLEDFLKKINQSVLFIGSFYFIEEILRLIKYNYDEKKY